jgi:hypothetical protein
LRLRTYDDVAVIELACHQTPLVPPVEQALSTTLGDPIQVGSKTAEFDERHEVMLACSVEHLHRPRATSATACRAVIEGGRKVHEANDRLGRPSVDWRTIRTKTQIEVPPTTTLDGDDGATPCDHPRAVRSSEVFGPISISMPLRKVGPGPTVVGRPLAWGSPTVVIWAKGGALGPPFVASPRRTRTRLRLSNRDAPTCSCQSGLTVDQASSYLDTMNQATELAGAASGRDPERGLRAVAALRKLLEQLEALQVRNARDQGWSWQDIATELGVSRQAVHQKYAERRVLRRKG